MRNEFENSIFHGRTACKMDGVRKMLSVLLGVKKANRMLLVDIFPSGERETFKVIVREAAVPYTTPREFH